MTKRKPASVGEILTQEFVEPMGLTQGALAEAMGVQRKHVNELCNNRRAVTAPTALILARVFGNSPDFWLNVQRRSDLWRIADKIRETGADLSGGQHGETKQYHSTGRRKTGAPEQAQQRRQFQRREMLRNSQFMELTRF